MIIRVFCLSFQSNILLVWLPPPPAKLFISLWMGSRHDWGIVLFLHLCSFDEQMFDAQTPVDLRTQEGWEAGGSLDDATRLSAFL